MNEQGSLGIFAEAGTGKTMIALTWVYDHLISGELDHVLVICPHSIISSWENAISKMSEFGYSEDEISIVRDAISLVSYNSVWIRNKAYKKGRKGERKYIIRPPYDKPWGAIFCDESHRLGDPSSVQTKVILRMVDLTAHRFAMSGTPDSQKYVKLYGQLKFIEPTLFEDYKEFDRRFVLAKDFFNNPIRYDTDALESLKRQYGTVARLRECFDMPDSTESDIPVPFTPKGLAVYKDMLKLKGEEYGISFVTAGVGSMKAKQVCTGFVYDDQHNPIPIPNDKIEALSDILESREGKVVIFCHYIPSLDRICALLDRLHVRYLRYDSSAKDDIWKDFQNDPSYKVIAVQYQRGSEGLDLFSSDCMIFFEPTSSAYILEQAKARIMRKGQTKKCSYYYIFTPDTLEERMMRSVRKGVDVSARIMDQWAEEERMRYSLQVLSDACKNKKE